MALAAGRAAVVPMGRVGTPEEVAEVCLFLASEECSYMNGSVLVADGGFLTHYRAFIYNWLVIIQALIFSAQPRMPRDHEVVKSALSQ